MGNLIAEKTKPRVKKPNRYLVILLNDDFTQMEFVIEVLMKFFAKSYDVANELMLKIHVEGEAVCGIYNFDIAQSKVTQVIEFSRRNNQPLMCIIREEIS